MQGTTAERKWKKHFIRAQTYTAERIEYKKYFKALFLIHSLMRHYITNFSCICLDCFYNPMYVIKIIPWSNKIKYRIKITYFYRGQIFAISMLSCGIYEVIFEIVKAPIVFLLIKDFTFVLAYKCECEMWAYVDHIFLFIPLRCIYINSAKAKSHLKLLYEINKRSNVLRIFFYKKGTK